MYLVYAALKGERGKNECKMQQQPRVVSCLFARSRNCQNRKIPNISETPCELSA